MVSLMSNIDMDLANKVITLEHLNHLPQRAPLYTSSSETGPKEDYPLPPNDDRMEYKGKIVPEWLKVLQHFFRVQQEEFPVKGNIVLWRKYHIRYKCLVGSLQSLNKQAINLRDDSYVWWEIERSGVRRYGQVVIFAIVHDWEPVAVVKPYRKVQEDKEFGIVVVQGTLGGMEVIRVGQIGGLVGRITKNIAGEKSVYLVGEW